MPFSHALIRVLVAAPLCLGPLTAAEAAVITTYYGDDDGFGLGKTGPTDTIDPVTSQADGTDAPFTDLRLIADDCGVVACDAPPFAPVDGFDPFTTLGVVTKAVLTLRVGAFDSGPNPFDGPNVILLDGLAVPSSFINGFSTQNTNNVQTRTIMLPSAFFPLIADGDVSLAGTHISNDTASGSFQVDMLSLTVTHEEPVPAPLPPAAALALAGLGALWLGGGRKRRGAG